MAFEGLDFYNLDDELSEDERLVRDNVRRFVDAEILPIIAKHYEAGTFPMELIPKFGELGLLGANAFMSHAIDLTPGDIEACVATGTSIVHNPSAIMSIRGRCPVPELIDAGVTVALGSDGAAPDRSYDMFRHMFQCMHYHRRHFRDSGVLPHGKLLEMVTIDAARALGLEREIG